MRLLLRDHFGDSYGRDGSAESSRALDARRWKSGVCIFVSFVETSPCRRCHVLLQRESTSVADLHTCAYAHACNLANGRTVCIRVFTNQLRHTPRVTFLRPLMVPQWRGTTSTELLAFSLADRLSIKSRSGDHGGCRPKRTRPKKAHFAVGMANSAPLPILEPQRCMTLFCLV